MSVPFLFGNESGPIKRDYLDANFKNVIFTSSALFGTVGDGIADDTSALQRFFNSMASTGGEGYIPRGTYLIRSKITINIGSIGWLIKGAGAQSVNIITDSTFVGATAAVQLLGNGTAVSFSLGGFSVKNQNPLSAATVGFQIGDPATVAINISGYNFSTIFDIHVQLFTTLWRITHARMIDFQRCSGWNQGFTLGANTCLLIDQNGAFTGDLRFNACQYVASSNSIVNCYCVNIVSNTGAYNSTNGFNQVAGIKFNNCDIYTGYKSISLFCGSSSWITDIWINNCQIDQLTNNAIYVESSNAGSNIEDLHISDCYMAATIGDQISLISSGTGGAIQSVNIHNSWLDRCGGIALNIFGAIRGCGFTDNVISNAASAVAAIYLGSASKSVIIAGNKQTRSIGGTYAGNFINVPAGSTDYVITNNINQGFGASGVLLDAGGAVTKTVSGNI